MFTLVAKKFGPLSFHAHAENVVEKLFEAFKNGY